MVEINIQLLPITVRDFNIPADGVIDFRRIHSERTKRLSEAGENHHIQHNLSLAVDGDNTTSFRSPFSECNAHSNLVASTITMGIGGVM